MPMVVPFVVTAITAVTSAVVAAGPIAVAAFNIANVALVAGGVMAAADALTPKVPSSGAAIEWTANPDAPMHFAAGRVGVAGQIVHNAVYGPDQMFVGFVNIVSAAGPIKGWVGFKADDAYVSFDGAGKAINTHYANVMWRTTRNGRQDGTDTALASPAGLKDNAAMPNWGSSYKLPGKACYMLTLAENSKRSAYKGKVPTGVNTIEGLFGWDPRLDSTYPGGFGPCRLNDPSTWVYLTNPILWALKWTLGLWEGPTGKGAPQVDYQVGGIGAKLSGIDVKSFVEAANVADANGWQVAAWPSTDDSKAKVLDSFLQAGGAIYAEKAGRIACVHRAAPRASIVTITGADTAGPIEIDTAASRINRINTIRPRYWSEAHDWQMTAADPVTADAWRAEDGGTRTRGVDYPYVPSAKQARELAALDAANTREGIQGVIPLRPYMQGLEPGDCITITEPDFVLNGLKCLLLEVQDENESDIIRATFVSETDGKFPFAFGQTTVAPEGPTLVPTDPTLVSPPLPEDWVIAPRPPAPDGTQVPGFDLSGVVSNATADAMLVSWREVAEGEDPALEPLFQSEDGEILPGWVDAGVWPPTTRTVSIQGPQSGAVVWLAIRYKRGNNYSAAVLTGPLTAGTMASSPVIDTEAPATPAPPTLSSTTTIANGAPTSAIAATWTANTEDDLNGYEVEVTNLGFTVVDYVATNAWRRNAVIGQSYAIRVRALDKAGNRSDWTVVQSITAAPDTTPPGLPTAVSILPGLSGFSIRCAAPNDADVATIELYENTTNNSATATLVTSVPARPGFAAQLSRVGLNAGDVRWYFLRAVDSSGNRSGLTTGAQGVIPRVNVTDLASTLTAPFLAANNTEATLLAGGDSTGKLYLNTTDRKLYRGTGGATWTRAADGADLTLDSISTGVLKAGVVATRELATDAVDARVLKAREIYAEHVALGTLTGDLFVAKTITTDLLAVTGALPVGLTMGPGGATIGQMNTTQQAVLAMQSDAVLSRGEKPALVRQYAEMSSEYLSLTSMAASLALSSTGFVTAFNAVTTYLAGLTPPWNDTSQDTTIDPAVFNARFNDYATAREDLSRRAAIVDPAGRINGGSTTILPGKILLAGASTLASWQYGGDATQMNGGAIATNTIAANKAVIGSRGVTFDRFNFSTSGNTLTWGNGRVAYIADSGAPTAFDIPGGSYVYSASGGDVTYLYWTQGAGSLATTKSLAVATTNAVLIGAYYGGSTFTATYGRTMIDGDHINVTTLSAISADIGNITAGKVGNAAGTTFLDLTNGRQQFQLGAYVWRQGAIGSGVLAWFGPASIAIGSETRTNGGFALGTDGVVYYGSAPLDPGAGGDLVVDSNIGQTKAGSGYGMIAGSGWQTLSSVTLTGVTAGEMIIASQEWGVPSISGSSFNGEVRLVDGATVIAGPEPLFIGNLSATDPVFFNGIAVGSGSRTYAIQARQLSGGALNSGTGAYSFARMASATTSSAGLMSSTQAQQLATLVAGGGGVSLATTPPPAIGSASVGTGTTAARADHSHAHGNQGGGSQHAVAVPGGASGFLSGTGAYYLNTVTPSNDANSLVWRDAGANSSFNSVFGAGAFYAPAFTVTSDEKTKKNIVDLDDALNLVLGLRPRRYEKRKTGDKAFGFVAQEIDTVLPESVWAKPDGELSVEYGTISAVLAGAIQELAMQVRDLQLQLDQTQPQGEPS